MVALFLRPDADQSDGSWLNESASATNLFNSVDEATTPSDTDYIVSSTTDGDKVRLRLSDPAGGVAAPFIVRYRCKRTGTQAANLIGRLYQGTSPGTLIATWTQLSVPDVFTTYTYTLTSGEFASITDFTDLYVEFELSQQSSLKVDLNFAAGVYYDSGTVADATSVLTCTRASTGYAQTSSGTLTSFASNVLRITDLGLLVENASTNYCIQSQAFDPIATGWNTSNSGDVTYTANTTVAPDGTTTGDSLAFLTASYLYSHGTSITLGANTFTFSVYLQGTAGNKIALRVYDAGSPSPFYTVVTLTAAWARYTVSGSITVTGTGEVVCGFDNRTLVDATLGTAQTIKAWGAQLEIGSFASSQVPTTTTSVTRAADAITLSGNLNTLFKGASGTGVADMKVLAAAGLGTCAIIVDTTASGDGLLFFDGSNTDRAYGTGFGYCFFVTSSWLTGVKVGQAFTSGAGSVCGDGGTTTTSATPWNDASHGATLSLNFYASSYFYMRRLTVWNTKLADATLQARTAP